MTNFIEFTFSHVPMQTEGDITSVTKHANNGDHDYNT